jgi:protein tyrosine/serine phosphatase
MPLWISGRRWVLAGGVALLIGLPPFVLFRVQYVTAKRFREVTPGRFYRSGQMTASGLRDTIDRYGIKTVINLQNEDEDPQLCESWVNNWFGGHKTAESEVCRRLGVKYLLLTPDILPEPNDLTKPPPVIKDYLAILDDEASYPILLHCKAGLHRTGRLTAIYRMEYENWTIGEALREMRANGYGYIAASEADKYVIQYVENYKHRPKPGGRAVP